MGGRCRAGIVGSVLRAIGDDSRRKTPVTIVYSLSYDPPMRLTAAVLTAVFSRLC